MTEIKKTTKKAKTTTGKALAKDSKPAVKSVAKKTATKKAAVKKTATKNSIKLKISFHLKYKTHFGQVIYLYGNHPSLGDNQIDQAIPMVYLNDDYWVLHVALEGNSADKIEYHYFILNINIKLNSLS